MASNGQGPPSITDRLRSTADGAQAAADLIGAGAAGLAAAQVFRSQLPQDAAECVRPNVLPRPCPAQPPPQIIGRPSDVERLLDEAGQRAQEVERGAQAVEETAAVAAEEGEVAVAAKGVGGAFGDLGELAEGAAALAPTAGEVAGTLASAPLKPFEHKVRRANLRHVVQVMVEFRQVLHRDDPKRLRRHLRRCSHI